jgi:hypothetical protein
MCVVYSYTLIHNNADKLPFSFPDQHIPRPPSQETNKVKWLAAKASKEVHQVVASVEAAEVDLVLVSIFILIYI